MPGWWRMIDAVFGVVGFIPMWLFNRWARQLEAAGLHDFWAHNPDLEALRDASAAAIGANTPHR